MPTWLIIAVTFVLTYMLSLIVRVLTSREKKVNYRIEHLFSIADDQFLRSLCSLLPPAPLDGNKVTALFNGDQFFPAMIEAIRGAQRTITFETFIYWQGEMGKKFADALIDRAKDGVKVHVLLDWLGTKKMSQEYLQSMKDAGIEVEHYHPLRWYNLRRLNHRTHRKLLIIDGQIGFTGGAGIADLWTGNAQDSEHWRDTHFKIEGPAVAQFQAAFMDNWVKTRSQIQHATEYFPELKPAGSCLSQMFMSSPSEGSDSARMFYLMTIASAAKTLRIANAYFVPDDLSVQTIVEARQRGVAVEIIVPGKFIDNKISRYASRSRWGALLEAGVEIYEYEPTMYHCKVMVVDDLWTSVGSTNFDNRSFRLNDEANLSVYDAEFAIGQIAAFEADKKHSKQITLKAWRNRSRRDKFKDWCASLVRSQM